MKGKKITILFIIGLLVVFFLVGFFAEKITQHYSREAYVELNDGEKIVFTDTWGHKWTWTAQNINDKNNLSLTKGEKVILTFDINKTYDDVNDDILVQITKEEKE